MRTQTSYYCRESEGFVSCRLFWTLPTPSSTTIHIQLQEDPHHAPWQPTPAPLQPTSSSRMTHIQLQDDPHHAQRQPTPCSMTTHTQLQDDPHPAPWQPTPSSTTPHPAPRQPTYTCARICSSNAYLTDKMSTFIQHLNGRYTHRTIYVPSMYKYALCARACVRARTCNSWSVMRQYS